MTGQTKALLKRLHELIASEENQRRIEVQRRINRMEAVTTVNAWNVTRGFPGAILAWFDRIGRKLDMTRVALATGPVSADFAVEMIDFQLMQKITTFETTPDDTPISPVVNTNLGLCWLYREGLLGENYVIDETSGAYVTRPTVKCEADLDALPMPRYCFDRALHGERMKVYREVAGDELVVLDDTLPVKIGAPFGTANNLRGGLEILMDFKTDPAFAHRIMRFVTDAILSFNREALAMEEALYGGPGRQGTAASWYEDESITPWDYFHGGVRMATMGSDEVSCDMFSAEDYAAFVLPYEREVCALYDKVYYHSCGNLTPIFADIVKLPNLHRLHVSPWGDMAAAVEAGEGKVILEKHLEPTVNLDALSEAGMDDYVRQVTRFVGGYPLDMVVPVQLSGGRRYMKTFSAAMGASV